MLVAGAGREVKWTNIPLTTIPSPYPIPTRYAAHPYNTSYKKLPTKSERIMAEGSILFKCTLMIGTHIRDIQTTRSRLATTSSVRIFPIRDLSSRKSDLLNRGSHLMIPAKNDGLHDEFYLNQY
jgi:hypothetical protein